MNLNPNAVLRALRASGKKHFFITGSRGSGKTRLFDALTEGLSCGIRSRKEGNTVTMTGFQRQGKFIIGTKLQEENCMTPITEAIETRGVALLENCIGSSEQTVAIDEIGYLECGSPLYQTTLTALLDKKNVLSCVRKDKYDFLSEILGRGDAFVVDLDEPVSGLSCIVLASGASRRFGGNKLMAPLGDKPVIAHTLEKVAELAPLFEKSIVATRYDEIATLSEIYRLCFVLHDLPSKSDTVRIAVEAIGVASGYLFLQSDQPLLTAETITALALAWQNDKDSIWRLAYRGVVATPVIFPGKFFAELRALSGDSGGSPIIKQNGSIVKILEAKAEAEVLDLDEPSDMAKLQDEI